MPSSLNSAMLDLINGAVRRLSTPGSTRLRAKAYNHPRRMPLSPGTRIGPYDILAPLGAGGMGQVYRATDTRLGRDVALKTLPAGFMHDAERLARFRREAQVLGR